MGDAGPDAVQVTAARRIRLAFHLMQTHPEGLGAWRRAIPQSTEDYLAAWRADEKGPEPPWRPECGDDADQPDIEQSGPHRLVTRPQGEADARPPYPVDPAFEDGWLRIPPRWIHEDQPFGPL